MKKHTEARLENAIIDHPTTQGGFIFVDYREGEAKDRYDKAQALDPALVLGFIQSTQERMWKSLEAIHKMPASILLTYLGRKPLPSPDLSCPI